MSEPIKRGDLVMVIRDCCGRYLGDTFTVAESRVGFGNVYCDFCRTYHPYGTLFFRRNGTRRGYPVDWLKRIPPLFELDDVKQDEEIHA